MKIDVIMPMLGAGTRMKGLQNTCKPLIVLDNNVPMFLQALKSLQKYEINNLILVIPRKYAKEFWKKINLIIQVSKCNKVFMLEREPTNSPVETFRIGYEQVSRDIPLVSLDCDIYADIPVFEDYKHGGIFYFESKNPNKSYIRTHYDYVTEIAEKNPISNKAVFGAYMFDDFRLLDEALKNQNLQYISDIYKELLLQGALIRSKALNTVYNFGTLKELNKYGKQELQSISI